MGTVLRGGLVVDPVQKTARRADVWIENGVVAEVSEGLSGVLHHSVDVDGCLVMPGLIDPHVHLREPGQTHKETIETGTRAAAAGGFTQVCAMPNTDPVTDRPDVVAYIRAEARRAGYAKVHPIAAVTKGSRGKELTDFSALLRAGAVGLSDDGRGVQSAAVMREAMVRAGKAGLPLALHEEDEGLSAGGVVHDGAVARALGLPGQPADSETSMVARDVVLAESTGARVHFCHVSPGAAVDILRTAKSRGLRISAEVTPHHLLLTEDAVPILGGRAKVNPPLRTEADRLACVRGFLDGTLDAVATDHAPHTEEEKSRPVIEAPFGFVGLETSFALMYTAFVLGGVLTPAELVARMSTVPARIFGLAGGRLRPGAPADIAVVDPRVARSVNPDAFFSKGRATPFAGRILYGWPVLTMADGRVTHDAR